MGIKSISNKTITSPGSANVTRSREVYLHPGQTYTSREPASISMILGSCVSVCLYDPYRSIGGATHYMLPKWDRTGQPSARYGDVAIQKVIDELQVYGSKVGDLRAMVFGGGCMFRAFRAAHMGSIGTNNVNTALETLSRIGIVIVRKDVGGESCRKVRLQTDTGAVSLEVIRNSQ